MKIRIEIFQNATTIIIMIKIPHSLRRIVADHAISDEKALECNWDDIGKQSIDQFILIVTQGFRASLVETERNAINSIDVEIYSLWEKYLEDFVASSDLEINCVKSRAIRACVVALFCMARLDSHFELLKITIKAFRDKEESANWNRLSHRAPVVDLGKNNSIYRENISHRLISLLELASLLQTSGSQGGIKARDLISAIRTCENSVEQFESIDRMTRAKIERNY